MQGTGVLSQAQIHEFNENGVLVIPSFYDPEALGRIQLGIYEIIGLLIKKYQLPISQKAFSAGHFDSGYNELIAANRAYGGEVYDAIKQIPAFFVMVGDDRHERLFKELRPNSMPGIAAGGYGIRIDNPYENKFQAPWHQEYPAQLRSPDGLVFWSSLVPISPDLGPVQICLGSHSLGPIPVHTTDPKNPEKSGAYSLILENEKNLVSRFEKISPCTNPGDLVILDFLVLHASGINQGNRSRWSMQFRYFNFAHPIGIKIGWKGSFAAGQDFRKIHPELCID